MQIVNIKKINFRTICDCIIYFFIYINIKNSYKYSYLKKEL